MSQEKIFLKGEGDRWFRRNRAALNTKSRLDPTLEIIRRSGLKPKKVFEIGCANGWRLEEIRKKYRARCVGIEPSRAAIKDGKHSFPRIRLIRAIASRIPIKEMFDLVIVNYVLHWISREYLVRSLSEIDRMVADNGYLVITDFAPDRPARARYHHLPEKKVWTFKTDYPAMFESTGLYERVKELTFHHETHKIGPAPSKNRGRAVLLKKSLLAYYAEQTL